MDRQVPRLKGFLFFLHSGMAIIVSFLSVYLKSLGLSGAKVGWLLAIGPVASIFAQPLWGYLSDRFKTVKGIMLTCLLTAMLLSLLLFNIKTFVPLMITMFVFYFFISPVTALGDSMCQRVANDGGHSFGSIRTWGSLGFASSALLAGQIFNLVGIENILWPYIFYLLGAFLVGLNLLDVRASRKPVTLYEASRAMKRPALLLFLVVILIISIAHRANDNFLGLYIYELGGGDDLIGWAWFIGVLSEAAIFATSSFWLNRFQELRLITLAALIYTFRWFLFFILQEPSQLVALQVLQGLCFGVVYAAAFQFISKLVPEELQSTGHLLFVTVFFGIAGIIGGLVGGYIIEFSNVRSLYYYLGYLSLAGSFTLLVYQQLFKKLSSYID